MAIWPDWNTCNSGTSTNNTVWDVWAGYATDSLCITSNCNAASTNVWSTWVSATSSSATGNDIWSSWICAGSTTSAAMLPIVEARQADPEVIAARRAKAEQRHQEWARREKERVQKREEADARAEKLLRAELTKAQLATLEAQSAFLVESEEGGRYRIKRRRVVEELDENGVVVATYCIHSRQLIPSADTMLAQKLMLEVNEAAFRQIGNRLEIRQ